MNKKLLLILLAASVTASCSEDKEDKPVLGESFYGSNASAKMAPQEVSAAVAEFFGKLVNRVLCRCMINVR